MQDVLTEESKEDEDRSDSPERYETFKHNVPVYKGTRHLATKQAVEYENQSNQKGDTNTDLEEDDFYANKNDVNDVDEFAEMDSIA